MRLIIATYQIVVAHQIRVAMRTFSDFNESTYSFKYTQPWEEIGKLLDHDILNMNFICKRKLNSYLLQSLE